MTVQLNYKTKKELKALVGTDRALNWTETSFFGQEYPENGTGKLTGCNKARSWFATVTLEDHKIVKVT